MGPVEEEFKERIGMMKRSDAGASLPKPSSRPSSIPPPPVPDQRRRGAASSSRLVQLIRMVLQT